MGTIPVSPFQLIAQAAEPVKYFNRAIYDIKAA